MDALLQDLRYAFRHLRHSPWFAAAAVLTLALGVGANTALFSMLNTLVYRPLPIKDPDGLVAVTSHTDEGQLRLTLVPAVTELEREGPLQSLCGLNGGGVFAAEANGTPSQTVIALVTGGCFETFGVNPLFGRAITEEDSPIRARGNMVTVLGHRFWMRMFGGDPGAIGKTIWMEGVELTIIGVMPPGFNGLQADTAIDIWAPNYTITPMRPERPAGASEILGRLKPGVTLQQAQSELRTRWPALLEAIAPPTLQEPERSQFTQLQPRVEPMRTGLSFYRNRYAQPLTIILALTIALLLLACVNLGGLLLARLNARSGELGIRMALGGSGRRIAQQMLIESLLLSLAGAAVAVPTSLAFVAVLASFLPTPVVDHSLDFTPDLNVLLATAACGVAAGMLMSALPIWLAWRRRGAVMSMWDRTVAGSANRWARGLLVTQVALSVVMLAGAGLLIRSLYLLQNVDRGVRIEHVLNVKLMPLPSAYQKIDNASYYPAVLERVRAIPGVRSAALTRVFPRMVSVTIGQPIAFVGDPPGNVRASLESASPEFFATVGIPLLGGRLPLWTDTVKSRQVAVISESLAKQLRADGDVIGRHVKYASSRADQDVEIVGIVGNASLGSPRQTDVPVFYRPTLQAGLFANYPNLLVAVDGDPLSVASQVVAAVKEGGREHPHRVDTVANVFASAPASERMGAALAGAVAALAIVLAFIGVYGLLAYAVSRRTREIGVRVALGASRSQVVGMIMREGFVLTVIGIAIGLPAAAYLGRILNAMMFGTSPADPLVLVSTTVFFIALGIAGGVIPARRAASVDPVIALRID